MDSELLVELKAGSLPAFERLYETHGGRMKSVAMNLLGSAADAEDAVQEAFLKVYRSAAGFRGGSSVSTWIYRILVNTCYDLMRKGFTHREAGGILDVKENTSRTLLFRAKRRLQRELSASGAFPPGEPA